MIVQQRTRQSDLAGCALHPVVQRVLEARGVQQDQLELRLAQLPQPGLLGLEQAIALLVQALEEQQQVVVCGDFDVDGATSTALMLRGLGRLGFSQLRYQVPDRFRMGYGLSTLLVEHVRAQGPTDLIITVDNGMSSHEAVQLARQYGIKVLITDHHLPAEQLPEADALVNPQQLGCAFPSKNMAGVGVAFYVLAALRSHLAQRYPQQNWPGMADLLDLVALGTVADVVPLDAVNRILVHQGLLRIRKGCCVPGIKALIAVSGQQPGTLNATDLGFHLGPRLNAAGRLEDMRLGIECLLTDDPDVAKRLAERLHALNTERRQIEQEMKEQALDFLETEPPDATVKALTLFHEQWHEGVIGLVASRLKDKFQRPVIALAPTEDPEVLKGSARSIVGAHMRDLLAWVQQQNPDTMLRFGGHAMAAGLSVKIQNLDRLRRGFAEAVEACVAAECFNRELWHDGELAAADLTLELAQALQQAGPWGQGFPEPHFRGVFKVVDQRLLQRRYLKLVVECSGMRLDAICFNPDLTRWPNPNLRSVCMIYALDINRFAGSTQLQLRVEHIE